MLTEGGEVDLDDYPVKGFGEIVANDMHHIHFRTAISLHNMKRAVRSCVALRRVRKLAQLVRGLRKPQRIEAVSLVIAECLDEEDWGCMLQRSMALWR